MTAPLRRLGALLLTVLAVLSVLALLPSSAQADPVRVTAGGSGWIRAGHFVPGMGDVQVALVPDGDAAAMSVVAPRAGYGDVTAYQRVAAGTYTVQIRPRGADASAQPMLSRSVTVQADGSSTIAVLGTSTAPRLVVLTDDLTPPAAGQARVRVISSAEQPVSVTADDGPTIASNVVLGQASGYTTTPQGRWRLQVSGASATPVTEAARLRSGSVYTLVVLASGSSTPSVQLITDSAGARKTPTGGVDTGGGGLAVRGDTGSALSSGSSGSSGVMPLVSIGVGALLLAAGVGLGRRRA